MRILVITGTGEGFCAGMYLGGRDAAPEPPTLAPDRPPARYVPVNLPAQGRRWPCAT